MTVEEAQRDVRTVFMGGFVGQLVAGGIWLAAAALATWGSPARGILFLVVGGAFIFPFTLLALRLMGRPRSLASGNPMDQLARQVAFTLPLNLPVVAGAAMYRLDWFFPAVMIVLGSHYLPFAFLYGMRMFLVLGAVLIGAGVGIGLYLPGVFSLGGWFTGVVLLLAAFAGRSLAAGERGPAAP